MKFFITIALLLPCIAGAMEKRKAFEALQEPRPQRPKITIFQAIDKNDAQLVNSLLQEQPRRVFSVDEKGLTPLHKAVKKGNAEIVRIILRARPNVDGADRKGRTPLMRAVRKGNLTVVQILLRADANPDLYDKESETPLEMALDRLIYALTMQDAYQQKYENNPQESIRKNISEYVKEANRYHGIIHALIHAGASPFVTLKGKKSVMEHVEILTKQAQEKGRKGLVKSYDAIKKTLLKG